jgi:hypothetical protein
LSVFLSPPDVVRALIPTVAVALVNAVPTLRIAKSPTLTHKELANYLTYTINISVFPKQQRIVTNILNSPYGFYLISGYYLENSLCPALNRW